ncbi:MAG: DUF1579 domain-containing protein [Phycisphaerales bacterium]|nr:DUF1579 domain-containing protein [Phycisphaerales bacterium]
MMNWMMVCGACLILGWFADGAADSQRMNISADLASGPAPASGPASSPVPVEPEVLQAMKQIDWLRGEWSGKGMLGTPSGEVTQNGPWKVETANDGRFLRLEFDAVVDDGKAPSNRFVGYFTFDAEKKHYRTVWLNVDNLFQFNETGTLDATGKVLTLISEHKRPDGTIGKVRSVFTKVDDSHVTCEDHRLDEKGEAVKKTFGFALTRK